MTRNELQQNVYGWLGYWRDKMPAEAVGQLQDILGTLASLDQHAAPHIEVTKELFSMLETKAVGYLTPARIAEMAKDRGCFLEERPRGAAPEPAAAEGGEPQMKGEPYALRRMPESSSKSEAVDLSLPEMPTEPGDWSAVEWVNYARNLAARLAAAEAREPELRKDAERYRRVFQEPAIEWEVAGGRMAGIEVVRFTTNPCSDPDYETLNKETADAGIDAALKREGG